MLYWNYFIVASPRHTIQSTIQKVRNKTQSLIFYQRSLKVISFVSKEEGQKNHFLDATQFDSAKW